MADRDGRAAKISDDELLIENLVPILAHDLKLREMRERTRIDFEKMAAEMGRLLIGNLMLINAGGLGAIPAISVFLGVQSLTAIEKIDLFVRPGAAFAGGLFAALLCGMVAYLNFAAAAGEASHLSLIDSGRFLELTSLYRTHEPTKDALDQITGNAVRGGVRTRRLALSFAFISIGLGLISLVAFLLGAYLLFLLGSSVPPRLLFGTD